MEESNMATLHINVPDQPGISGTIPLPLVSGTNYYTTPLGTFAMTEAPGFSSSGNGSTLNISGRFSISGVGDNYGTVTFDGTYVNAGGNGSGNVSWDGSHAGIDKDTGDPWTSDVTIPAPKSGKPEARAKGQTY
jgi:hypothetical protein